MRLTSKQREKIVTVGMYIFLYLIFVPAWILDKIFDNFFVERGQKIRNWAENKTGNLIGHIQAWIDDTPEKTIEILKRKY